MIPYLREGKQKREIIDVFGGYNANLRIKEGEWSDTQGISLDHYPVFSPRFPSFSKEMTVFDGIQKEKTYYYRESGDVLGIISSEGEAIATLNNFCTPSENSRLISFGAYIIILPELYYVNTVDHEDKGYILTSCSYMKNGGTISGKTFIPVSAQFVDFEQADEPASAQIGQRWRKTTDGKLYELRKKEWKYQQIVDFVQASEPSFDEEGQSWLNTDTKEFFIWHSDGTLEYKYTVDSWASAFPSDVKNGQKFVRTSTTNNGLYVAETEWIEKTNDEIKTVEYVDELPEIVKTRKTWVQPEGDTYASEYYVFDIDKGWEYIDAVMYYQDDSPSSAEVNELWYNPNEKILYQYTDPGVWSSRAEIDYDGVGEPQLPTLKKYYSEKNKPEIYYINQNNTDYEWKIADGAYTQINNSNAVEVTKLGTLAEGMQVYVTSVVNGSEIDLGERIMKDEKTVKGGLYLAYGMTELKLECKPPIMDFMFECGNRMWGCRYGLNHHGEFVNEIYASALGDFKNWSKFAGVSTDSFIASIGTDGPFSGACNYLGYPIFFKENCIHKVYGAYPAQYQVQTTMCPGMGVEKGSDRSLSVCASQLYYKAKNCIAAYDGNYPVSVSSVFGPDMNKYGVSVAGSYREKYFITMKNNEAGSVFAEEGVDKETFVYYPRLGKWIKDRPVGVPQAKWYLTTEDNLEYAFYKDGNYMGRYIGQMTSGYPAWSATSGIWQITSPDKKYVSKLTLRMTLPATSTFKAEIEYDSSGDWKTVVEELNGNGLASFNLPILPRRCDHLRLRISGSGDCKIYSITKTIEEGSDV